MSNISDNHITGTTHGVFINGAGSVQDVLLPEIVRSPFNRDRSAERNTPAWKEFVESIRQHGIIEPLIARPLPSALDPARQPGTPRLELVIGEGRWLGAAEAGLESAPVIVRQLTDLEAIELQAIENAQRKDLNPLQEAAKYQQLLEHYEKNALDKAQAMAALCEKMARSKSAVYETLRLLELQPKVQEAINRGVLPVSHAGLIAKLPPEFQERTAYAIAPGKKLSDQEDRALESELGYMDFRDEETGLVPFRDAKEVIDELQREIKQSEAYEKLAAAHRAKGGTALTLAEAKKTQTITPGDYLQEYGGYVREAIQGVKELPAMIMVPSARERSKPEMVYRRDELLAALKKAGVKARGNSSFGGGSRTDYAAMERKRKERERREKEVRTRVQTPIRAAAGKRNAKIPWPLVLQELGGWSAAKRACDLRGWKCGFNDARDVLVAKGGKLPENQMAGLLSDVLLAHYQDAQGSVQLRSLGKFYGVDVEAIEKEVKAQFAPSGKKSAQKEPVQTPGKKTRAKPSAATKAKIAAALRKTKGGAQ